MSSQSGNNEEYSPEVIALAHKIHRLNGDIQTYKSHITMLEGKIKVLKNEIYELKGIIGLQKIHYENERNKDKDTNRLVSSDFEEILGDTE